MIIKSGLGASGKDFLPKSQMDLSFIVKFNWKSSSHLKEAIRLLVNARVVGSKDGDTRGEDSQGVLEYGEYRNIRIIIASNPNTPPAVLEYVAKQSAHDEGILERVAGNPRASDHTLVFLAHSKFACVRAAVAENVNATPDILTVLGTDSDADVRFALAENPHLPLDFLAGLAEDHNPYVAHRAAATLARLEGGTVVDAFGKRQVVSFGGEHQA